jgi:hypothetical protein
MYLYAVAIMFQVMVYPPFAIAAWRSKGRAVHSLPGGCQLGYVEHTRLSSIQLCLTAKV